MKLENKVKTWNGQFSVEIDEWNCDTIEKEITLSINGQKYKYYLDSAQWNGFKQVYLLVYKQYED